MVFFFSVFFFNSCFQEISMPKFQQSNFQEIWQSPKSRPQIYQINKKAETQSIVHAQSQMEVTLIAHCERTFKLWLPVVSQLVKYIYIVYNFPSPSEFLTKHKATRMALFQFYLLTFFYTCINLYIFQKRGVMKVSHFKTCIIFLNLLFFFSSISHTLLHCQYN